MVLPGLLFVVPFLGLLWILVGIYGTEPQKELQMGVEANSYYGYSSRYFKYSSNDIGNHLDFHIESLSRFKHGGCPEMAAVRVPSLCFRQKYKALRLCLGDPRDPQAPILGTAGPIGPRVCVGVGSLPSRGSC